MSAEPTPPPSGSAKPPGRRSTALVLGSVAVLAAVALFWWRSPAPDLPAPGPARVASGAAQRPAPGAVAAGSAPRPDAGAPAAVAEAEPESEAEPVTVEEQKAALLERMRAKLRLDAASYEKVRALFAASSWLSQGNPKITEHPMTRAECLSRRRAAGALPAGDARCGAPNMVPLYDPSAGQTAKDARACIDQYEFPNLACDYPVVYVQANEAVELCRAVGKRICDAHEWEGACAGAVKPAETEYAFGERRLMIEYLHNKDREIVWSYGKTKDHLKCATQSRKSPKCHASEGFGVCGSNTYPAGAFPECRSPLGAFDLHGNAAEHMNLPLVPAELASRGGLGETEMKGSWFVFAKGEAHADDCRWRAPSWHKTRIDAQNSHRNYHLGFRCCRDI